MDHKKISLNPDDLKKLQALLKKEENAVDAMTDEDLELAEKNLEKRIKDLAGFAAGLPSKDADRIDASWQKLQKHLNPMMRADLEDLEKDHLISLQKPRRGLPWVTIGALAAAALALLVLYPVLRQDSLHQPGDLGQMQTKGGHGSGESMYSAFCELDYRGPSADSVEEAGQGLGHDVDAQVSFKISVSCDQAGYIQVWSQTAPALEVRDSKVLANVRSFVIEEGKATEFSLSGKPEMLLEIALTDRPLTTETNLFEVKPPVSSLGEAKVLWADSLAFREKK